MFTCRLTVPTVAFRTLYVFVVLSLDRRRIVHFNVTTLPTAGWTALQLFQAFPYDTAPRFLVRDRDGIYGSEVVAALVAMGIEQKVISARAQLGLEKDTPDGRTAEPPELGPVQRRAMVGGLHSRYYRVAA